MPLDAERAWIFRISHIDNVDWDLEHGLQCRSSPIVNPSYRNIGNLDLIEKRKSRVVPIQPGGTLSDYVPFYFTSRSPMLYNIKTGYNGIQKVPMSEIVIYAASLRQLAADGVDYVFTDRHAKLATAKFFRHLSELDRIDWRILQRSDFRYDPADPEKMDRYQAEALIHCQLPCAALTAVVCYGQAQASRVSAAVDRRGHKIRVVVRPEMFF